MGLDRLRWGDPFTRAAADSRRYARRVCFGYHLPTDSFVRCVGSADHAAVAASITPRWEDRELAILRERLTGALAGQGGLVLIGGEAGIGKTALAEAICRESVEQGALVLVGRCYDLTEIPPYGPWAELSARYRPAVGMASPPAGLSGNSTARAESQTELFQQSSTSSPRSPLRARSSCCSTISTGRTMRAWTCCASSPARSRRRRCSWSARIAATSYPGMTRSIGRSPRSRGRRAPRSWRCNR